MEELLGLNLAVGQRSRGHSSAQRHIGLTVQYEDNVADFENQVRRILDFCELPWEDACLRFYETDRPIRTASSEQVRQPIYSDSLNFWKRYQDELGELIEAVEPIRNRYRHLE